MISVEYTPDRRIYFLKGLISTNNWALFTVGLLTSGLIITNMNRFRITLKVPLKNNDVNMVV